VDILEKENTLSHAEIESLFLGSFDTTTLIYQSTILSRKFGYTMTGYTHCGRTNTLTRAYYKQLFTSNGEMS